MAFARRYIQFLMVVITGVILLAGLAFSSLAFSPHQAAHASGGNSNQFYVQTNLVSDLANIARFQDPNLVNSWGLAHGPNTPWFVADNGTGVSTDYDGQGRPIPFGNPLVITIPPPKGSPSGTTAAPTGIVFNDVNGTNPNDFVISKKGKSGPSIFMFATEDGTISGWNPKVDKTNAILVVDRSKSGAIYKGLAIGQNQGNNFIYATNFHAGKVEMFDANFKLVSSFTDPKLFHDCPLPGQCFAPFGIQNIGGEFFVTFALQKAGKHDDQVGSGNGFVDVFDTAGNLLFRFASHGKLNSPWGLTLTLSDFGSFSNDLLVGNFGDGYINIFKPNTLAFLGQLPDQANDPIVINGLWGIAFGNGNQAGELDELFFASGLNDEADGLF